MKPPLSRYIALAQPRTMVLMSRRGPLLENKDGEKKIAVPPSAPIVRYEIGGKGDLKAGARFTVLARDQEAGRHAGGEPHQRRTRRRRAPVGCAGSRVDRRPIPRTSPREHPHENRSYRRRRERIALLGHG